MISNTINELKKINKILNNKQKRVLFVLLLFGLLAAILETLGVTIIVPLVELMITPNLLFEYSFMQKIINFFDIKNVNEMIILVITGTVVLFIIKNIYMIFFSWLKIKCSTKIKRELSVYMLESYMNRGYTFFINKNANEIIQGVEGDTSSLHSILNLMINIFVKFVTIAMIGLFMFLTDWVLALGIIIASVICLFVLIFGLKRPMKKVGEETRIISIKQNKILLQAIFGIKEIIVMRKQREFVERYKDTVYLRQKQEILATVGSECPAHIIEAFCITVIMIVLGVKMIIGGSSAVFLGGLASFAAGSFRILPSIGQISGNFASIMNSKPGLDKMYENIIEARKYNDRFYDIDARDENDCAGKSFSDSIVISDITFKYANNLDYVLEKVSLDIQKNTSVALVGESGAGKSTLADIMLGILPAQSGRILVDGVDIRDIPVTWSKLIGFVPQSIYLSDASVAENVAFGIKEIDIDIGKVRKALQMANALKFVEGLPDGLNTYIGDRGLKLSGGQRQRIGIARALYHEPQILILDEATSALDNDTEKHVMEAIETLKGHMTMIIIAHRLTTIQNCDKIYEIVDKRAVERKYVELL